ncbi:MAG TPA: FAD-dependent oxidoreductase, partial [Rhizomicrobium sp.]
RHDRAGGLLIYGIPNFKLEKDIVERRVKRLVEGGVKFNLNFDVGPYRDLQNLRSRHDAILLATGVYKPREMGALDAQLGRIVPALDYLIASNRKGFGDPVLEFDNGTLNAEGKNVAVIGGGDTAMDCVRTAIRQGAEQVSCIYRRDMENMPGSLREVANADEEGIVFEWLTLPKAFLGKKKVSGVRLTRMRLGTPDHSGRKAPVEIADSEFTLDADLVIKALGFDAENLPQMFDAPGLGVSRSGTLSTDPKTLQTTMDGVFAAGDIARGASLVVWAIKDGRDAAASIHKYLEAKAQPAQEAAE